MLSAIFAFHFLEKWKFSLDFFPLVKTGTNVGFLQKRSGVKQTFKKWGRPILYICIILLSTSPTRMGFHEGWNFCLLCTLLCPQHLDPYLVHSKHSPILFNEWMRVVPWEPDCFQMQQLYPLSRFVKARSKPKPWTTEMTPKYYQFVKHLWDISCLPYIKFLSFLALSNYMVLIWFQHI